MTEPTPLLVVMGAGASYDSVRGLAKVAGRSDRPPLASELFGSRYDRYVATHPACGALVAYLRRLPETTNLEVELDRIQSEEMPNSPLRRRQVIALRYYLRDLLRDA